MENNSSDLESKSGMVKHEDRDEFKLELVSTEKDDIFTLTDCTTADDLESTNANSDIDLFIGPKSDSDQLYCCNTCNISFISITDHVREHHSDQEVVIEIDETEDLNEESIQGMDMVNGLNDETADSQCIDQNLFEISTSQSLEECIIVDEEYLQDQESNTQIIAVNNTDDMVAIPKTLREVTLVRRFVSSDLTCEIADVPSDKITEDVANQSSTGSYQCFHCNITYVNSKSYCAHMKIHKNLKKSTKKGKSRDNDPYECKVCHTVFPSHKSLTLHKRMHDTDKPKLDAPLVQPHKDLGEENGSNVNDFYHCSVCKKWIHVFFRTIHDKTHTDGGGFNCIKCNKRMINEDSLIMHMKVHATEKTVPIQSAKKLLYKCNYCNKQFGRPYDKVKHERIHTGEKPFKCNVCSKSFRVSHCLTLHLRTHTGARPYECEHCGKKFTSHSVHNHHILLHSDVRGYKCTFCPKSFKTAVQLAGHKNSHVKPYSCSECNRPFSSLYSVRMHMEKHKRFDNMRYKCQLCGASYVRDFALKEHLKEQHNIYPERDSEPETEIATEFILPN